MQNTSPLTPLEPCEWLNKLVINLWPNYMEPRLSHKLAEILMNKLKEKKPNFIENIELQEFSLGLAPPALGMQCTYWTTEVDEQVLHTGFEWDTNEMSILLAATLAGPINRSVRFVINSLHLEGDLRIVPILGGHSVLYSFESTPEIRIGVAFGGASESTPSIEIPGISSWLENVMSDSLNQTMVEPHRKCFSFPAVDLNKSASDAIISVTVVSGNNLGAPQSNSSRSRNENDPSTIKHKNTLVEVRLEHMTRKTSNCHGGGLSPRWDETFDMMLHGSSGSIYFNVYEQCSTSVEFRPLGQCKIKVKYTQDGSTVFWAIGTNNSSIAMRAEHCGKEVTMTVPLEGNDFAEITVKLLVKEWHFTQVPRLQGVLGSLSSFQATTGRILKISVAEGKNLAAKDKSGKSDPYVLLQYGKAVRKTKTIPQNLNPIWKQTFEFVEIGGGEYLKLKCYDADLLIDDILGSARVNLEGLEDDKLRDIWVPLENTDTGEIRLVIKAVRSQSNVKSKSSTSTNGMLELVLLEARHLVAADLRGTSDPFVSVHYGNQKKRTKVIYKTLHPQWNQTLEFPDDGKSLELHVKDHNAVLPTSSIGHCTVKYQSLPHNQMMDMWIPLQGVRKGEIHIQVTRRLHQTSMTPSRNDTVNNNALLEKMSTKICSIVKEAHSLVEDGEIEQLFEKIDEVESVEIEQDIHILQLLKEREMLLSKVSELEKEMEHT